MARGTLRVYLGAAPGVGKTFAMLNEGRRRDDRGTDVVVAYVETHGRPRTAEQVGDLEVIPRRTQEYRGTSFEEMDVDAVLHRRPEVALVDELAHTNAPGSKHAKRWQDVDEILEAGIDVISTVNIQHLESINDVVERITGVAQRETIPDDVVRAAAQVELVDMTPEALRRRLAHGNVYAPEKIDAALTNYFREGNLAVLRELALLWVADQVDVALEDYRNRHGITQPWETRERVVVALTGAPGTEDLIRRASRIAQRAHGELLGVHARSEEGLVGSGTELLAAHRQLLEEVGGEYHEIAGSDIATALLDFARAENATQLILGSSRQNRWHELTRGSVINRVIRMSGPIDVHVISHEPSPVEAALPRPSRRRATVAPRRRLIAWLLTVIGLPVLTLVLAQLRDELGLQTVILLYLLFVIIDAAIGGLAPAIVAAVAGSLLVNWYFTPPIHTLTISDGENVLALGVYLLTAVIVSGLVASRKPPNSRSDPSESRGGDAGCSRERCGRRRPAADPDVPPPPIIRLVRRRAPPPEQRRLDGRGGRRRQRGHPRRGRRRARRRPGPGARPVRGEPRSGGPPDAERVRIQPVRGARSETPPRPGIGGDRARRGQRAAQRAPASGVARPSDAVGRDQGIGQQPSPARRELDARGDGRVPRDCRRRDRPSHQLGRQPARHVADPGGRGRSGIAADDAR